VLLLGGGFLVVAAVLLIDLFSAAFVDRPVRTCSAGAAVASLSGISWFVLLCCYR
jgi:hypothetical protein